MFEIKKSFEENPRKPLKARTQENKISKTSCFNTTKILGLKAYQIRVVHELLVTDYDKRIKYCEWFLEFTKKNFFLNITIFTDEAWFHLSGNHL